MLRSTTILILIAASFAPSDASAQRSPTFDDQTPLDLRISGPLRELGRDPDDRPEHPAVIEFPGPDGETIALDIQIRIRGNSRVRECRFPPLSLQFTSRDTAGTVFDGQDRLKLVTLCSDSSAYRGYLAQEFLIYRMLNVLTERSFRVRWATVEYLDTSVRRPRPRTEPAFLIEADWEVAERLGLDLIEMPKTDVDAHDPGHAALLSVFQYVIGNTDWSMFEGPPGEDCCHNGKVVGNAEGPLYVIPYDFDNSGLIAAEYAVPAEGLSIRRVTTRLYRGLCRWNAELPAVFAEFNRQRARIEALFDSDVIEERARRRPLVWLEDSFEIINDTDARQNRIYDRCG